MTLAKGDIVIIPVPFTDNVGRLEDWKIGRLEDWNDGRLE